MLPLLNSGLLKNRKDFASKTLRCLRIEGVKIFAGPALCFAFIIFLTGCDNPTSVGLPLIGEEGGRPSIYTIAAESATEAELNEITGNRSRVLSGTVNDPIFGVVMADGYIDPVARNVQDGFLDGTITSATLELPLDYVYGDTLSSLTLQLFDMASEWSSDGARADTTLTAGQAITLSGNESNFLPTDSLLRITLPAGWIARNDTSLQSESFNDSFHGFKIDVSGGNAVVGFDAQRIRLVAVAGGDSAFYRLPGNEGAAQKTLTTFTREAPPSIASEDLLPVQLLVGPTVHLSIPLPDSLLQNALNDAAFVVYTDTTLSAPPNFVRPMIDQLDLIGVTEDGTEVPLAETSRNDEGQFIFDGSQLQAVLQAQLLGDFEIFTHLRLAGDLSRLPGDPSTAPTINTLLVYDVNVREQFPRLILTLTQVD